MPLYTFVMEYAGGTYISQVKAASPNSAGVKWAQQIDAAQIKNFGRKSKEALIRQMKSELPTPVDGVLNTWCVSAHIRGVFALIHIIQREKGIQSVR